MGSRLSLDSTMNIANEMTQRIGFNPQATYAPIVRDTFYQLVPADFKFYYFNAVRRALYWYQGFVPEIHNPSVGLMATGIGNTVIKELTKLIVGGKVFFEVKGKDQELKNNESTVKAFRKWSDEYKFQNTLKTIIEYSAAGGTGALVSYVNDRRDLFTIPYRTDQFFYSVGFSNKIQHFVGFIGFYTAQIDKGAGRRKEKENFYLVEERFYDDNLNPMKKFSLKRASQNVTTAPNFDITEADDMKWEQIPKNIRKLIKRDFPDIKIGEEYPIKFTYDLGVDLVRFTTTNRVPEVKMGESALLNVFKYMIDYEYAESALDTDMYLGRGKVLIPEQLRNPTDTVFQTYYSGYDSLMFTKMPMRKIEDQKPISVQFDLRAEEWTKMRNNIAEKIASTIGVGGSDIFAYLRDATGSSKTATQIADETRKTLSFVEEKRDIIKNDLDSYFERWSDYYRFDEQIKPKFSSQNLVNRLVTLDEMRVKKEIGISTKDLFNEVYPDKSNEEIDQMVERKFEEMEKIKKMDAQIQGDAFEERMTKINGRKEGAGITEGEETSETEETEETTETKDKNQSKEKEIVLDE
jgi:hypothetical protein